MIWKYSGEVHSEWLSSVFRICPLEVGHWTQVAKVDTSLWPRPGATYGHLYMFLCSSLYRQKQKDSPSLEFTAPVGSKCSEVAEKKVSEMTKDFFFKMEHWTARSSPNLLFSASLPCPPQSHQFGNSSVMQKAPQGPWKFHGHLINP